MSTSGQIIATYGVATYLIFFLIIFMETGLVFTPFTRGFAPICGGCICGFELTQYICIISCDDWCGHSWRHRKLLDRAFFWKKNNRAPKIPIDEKHIKGKQQIFYKYGGKTIIIGRFMPFVRTFAPFVAGIGSMSYGTFIGYNILGGILWVGIATLAGFFFGNIEFVKENFLW